jgi:TolB protein
MVWGMLALAFSLTVFGCVSTPMGTEIIFDPSTLRNVIRISDDKIEKGWVAVSADGQKILYCEQPTEMDLSAKKKTFSSRIMYLRDASVFAKSPLIESFTFAPAWYENGTTFVYVALIDDDTQLLKSSVSGGGKTFVSRNPIGRWDNHPNIKDGIIVCDTWINGARQIVSLRDNGTEITVLGPGEYPYWHPSEPKVVFIKDGGIWEMDTETTQQTQLYEIPAKDKKAGVRSSAPVYSRDGKFILFQKLVKVGSGGLLYWHLFRMDRDGANVSQLTDGRVDVYSPAYGAADQIFFISNASGKTEIWSAQIILQN